MAAPPELAEAGAHSASVATSATSNSPERRALMPSESAAARPPGIDALALHTISASNLRKTDTNRDSAGACLQIGA
jgi:hypothetical protein